MEHHTDWVNDIVLCCGGRTCKWIRFVLPSLDGVEFFLRIAEGSESAPTSVSIYFKRILFSTKH